jgi:hypothetical protein
MPWVPEIMWSLPMTKSYRYRGLSGVLHIIVDSTQASLWGVEANYPGSDNICLSEVADELLPEAVVAGRTAIARLIASAPASEAQA